MSDGIVTIDNTEYFAVEHKNSTYYIGEEVLLNSDQKEIGWFASRGGDCIITAVENGEEIARMHINTTRSVFDNESDIIEAINFLHNGTFSTGWESNNH